MPTAKPIPTLTLEKIIPPNTDYAYFQDTAAFPFERNAPEFSLTNAWWLMEAALLAYAEESVARPQFESAGFSQVRFFNGPGTQCYLLANDHFGVLAFRGTEFNIRDGFKALNQFIADLKTDFDFWLMDAPDSGKIHGGFDKALNEIWPELLADLQQHTDRPLWITGHSLGGALATLAAARYKKARAVYTFGSPRVGDAEFGRRFYTPAFRFVNHNDVVTKVPPRPYHHIGRLCRLDDRGRLAMGAQARKPFFKILGEKMAALISALRTPKISSEAPIPEGLKDHTPLLYALHIWNNLVMGY